MRGETMTTITGKVSAEEAQALSRYAARRRTGRQELIRMAVQEWIRSEQERELVMEAARAERTLSTGEAR